MAKKKFEGNYIFPGKIARVMKGISQRTQYEAGIMSITVILIGLMIMMVLIVFFTDASLFVKIMTVVNGLAGFVFLFSFLVTTFQQYQNYLAMVGLIDDDTIKGDYIG